MLGRAYLQTEKTLSLANSVSPSLTKMHTPKVTAVLHDTISKLLTQKHSQHRKLPNEQKLQSRSIEISQRSKILSSNPTPTSIKKKRYLPYIS